MKSVWKLPNSYKLAFGPQIITAMLEFSLGMKRLFEYYQSKVVLSGVVMVKLLLL